MSEHPYLLVADCHCHAWSAFATTDAAGLNSRLHIILNELLRAADELIKRDGRLMFVAGDLFHVRGSIDPEVFNPVHTTLNAIRAKGITVVMIPGNHDLKGRDTTELGNAFQSLNTVKGGATMTPADIWVITSPCVLNFSSARVGLIPWCSSHDKLNEAVKALMASLPPSAQLRDIDLVMHAGIDGVLSGVPASGLTAAECASWGFKRVFAGHYHHHCVMESDKVTSIGATTHQTWSDIGTKAGFMFVYPDRIEWQASHAPEFVEITGEDDPDEIPLIVDGNYVRVRAMKLSDPEIKTFRQQLEDMGARGVTFQVAREAVVARAGVTSGTASTLDEQVDKFIDTLADIDAPAVKVQCADVLTHIRSVAA